MIYKKTVDIEYLTNLFRNTSERHFSELKPLTSTVQKLISRIRERTYSGLVAAALSILVSLLFFGFWIPLVPSRASRPTFELAQEIGLWRFLTSFNFPGTQNGVVVAILVLFMASFAFLGYCFAVLVIWKKTAHRKIVPVVIGAALFFGAIGIWFLPNFNTDIFNYILRARIVSVHGGNPYYQAADDFPDDPIYPYASHRYTKTPGGKFPGWMHLNVFLSRLAGNDPVTNLLVYRAALFLIHAANVLLILFILRRINPDKAALGVLLYGWNPVTILNCHSKTETVMIFYLLAGVLLLTYNRNNFATILLTLSAAVKLITAPLLAIFIIGRIKRRHWRQVAIQVGIILATVLLIYVPFWQGPGLFFLHEEAVRESGSLTLGVMKGLFILLFLGVVIRAGLKYDGSATSFLKSCGYTMLFFSLFLTKIGLAWYLMTFIAVVSLSATGWMTMATLLLSFSSFLFNGWYSTFSSEFNVGELFTLPKLVVYVALPAIALALCGGVALWRHIKLKDTRSW